jgi:hypothetical protein
VARGQPRAAPRAESRHVEDLTPTRRVSCGCTACAPCETTNVRALSGSA